MRVACTYNCDLRNNGTAAYAMRALKEMEGVEAFHVRAPTDDPPKADWYLYMDDGRDDLKWIPPSPNAYWAIDTHLGFGYRLWKARQFDEVFVAQKDDAARFKSEGIKNVHWLPLACHPDAHLNRHQFLKNGTDPVDLTEVFDCVFVGFLNDAKGNNFHSRVSYLHDLFEAFPNSWLAMNVFFEEMALRFVRGKLGFNISIRSDLNMRVFEVMSTGTALLTNRDVHGIEDLFTEGVHFFGYKNKSEMLDVARRVIRDDPLRNQVAAAGMEHARKHHTYGHRMERIAEVMRNYG